MATPTAQQSHNPTDDDEANLAPSAETVAKNSFLGQFFIKIGYIYLIGLNLVVLFYDNVPISLQLLSTSIGCIILGSFQSLRHPESAEAKDVERLKPKDAYMFPVFGSIALCSFYVAIKYLPDYVVDIVAQTFFVVMSAFATQSLFDELALQFIPKILYNMFNVRLFTLVIKWNELYTIPVQNKTIFYPSFSFTPSLSASSSNEDEVELTLLNVITLIFGSVVAYLWYYWDQYWFFNNLIGISLSIQAIAFLNPGSYYTAAVLLSLLFFYDIFWVFGTDVMVTVAKNLKAPIKLIFPRPAVVEKPNMLGLGDIVLPGIYIALLLRYDVRMNYKNINFNNIKSSIKDLPKMSCNTFYASLVCYFLSLSTCILCMWFYEAAQPALLYIVPGIILPILLIAFIRGDFNSLWSYDEEPDNEKKKEK